MTYSQVWDRVLQMTRRDSPRRTIAKSTKRATFSLRKEPGEPVSPEPGIEEGIDHRKRPEPARYTLQVDGQTKASYSTYSAAQAAGLRIKRDHPVVQVTIYDTEEFVNSVIQLPAQ